MTDPLYVIQVITDGADGHPYDEVLSIAVCKVDLDGGDFDTVFNEVIQAEPRLIGKTKLDYAEARGLKVSDLYTGTPLSEVVEKLRTLVKGQYVTSYDIRQEFSKYLCMAPWDLTKDCTIVQSISVRQPISLRCKYPEDETDIIVKAYRRTFKKDPLQIGRKRGAMELAQMASMLAISLRARGKY